MCDHNWILLTSKEYERMVFDKEDRPWDVRGCLQCKEIQKREGEATTWRQMTSAEAEGTDEHSPATSAYFKRLRLFAGGRDV